MKQSKDISTIGSRYTFSVFKLKNGDLVRILVWFTNSSTISNTNTYYEHNVKIKPKGHKLWKEIDNQEIKSIITDQILYEAYFNHWQTVNPLRYFNQQQVNGELKMFTVEELKQPKQLKALKGHK